MELHKRPNVKTISWLTSLLVIWVCTLSPGAFAQGSTATDLDAELVNFAKRTIEFLTEQEQETITIGSITGTGKGSIPGGPGISAELAKTLNKIKPGVVSDTATWTIEGRMLFGNASAGGQTTAETENVTTADVSLTIFFTLINQNTQQRSEDKVVITKLTRTAFFVGGTLETSPQADIKEARKDFIESLTEAPFIDTKHPSRVRANEKSPFALELRVKPIGAEAKAGIPVDAIIENRPGIIATKKQPFAFASIGKNQEYEIVVYNESSDEIAASIAVDGIDVFSFSEDIDPKTNKSLFTHFVIAPGGELVLPGWHKTIDNKRDDNFLAFLVTEYGKGARSKLFPQQAVEGTVGAVTVGISKTIKPGGIKSAQAETGFGRPIKQDQKPVERTIEPAHVYITVRYDR